MPDPQTSPRPRRRDKFLSPIKNWLKHGSRPNSPLIDESQASAADSAMNQQHQTPNSTSEPPTNPHPPKSAHETDAHQPGIGESVYQGMISQQKAGNWSGRIMSTLRCTLGVLGVAGSIFPPLQAAAEGLLKVLDRVDLVITVQEDFEDLSRKLASLANVLREYDGASLPEAVKKRLQELVSLLNIQQSIVLEKLKDNLAKRTLDVNDNAEMIGQILRAIDILLVIFTIDVSLSTSQDVGRLVASAILGELSRAKGASFWESQNEGCLSGTRERVMDEILDWAETPGSPPIYWLSANAGAGKTTVIKSICHKLYDRQACFASFMCSRQGTSDQFNAQRIIPTLAYTFASLSPLYSAILVSSLKKPHAHDIARSSDPRIQCKTLFMEPLQKLHHASDSSSLDFAIVIDGLDECNNEQEVQQLLTALRELCESPFSIKLLLACRPEPDIRCVLDEDEESSPIRRFLLGEVPEAEIQADLQLYFTTKFEQIRKQHRKTMFTDPWPSEEQMKTLMVHSAGLFIYASTAIAFIGRVGKNPPDRLLQLIEQPYLPVAVKPIDHLYQLILHEAFDGLSKSEADDIMKCLRGLAAVQGVLSLKAFAALVGLEIHKLRSALAGLHSAIRIPPEGDDEGLLSPYHASFLEYVTNPERTAITQAWFTDRAKGHDELGERCLRIVKSQELDHIIDTTTGAPLRDGDGRVRVAEHVLYSCKWWPDHVVHFFSVERLLLYTDFLRSKLPIWLEVLSTKVPMETIHNRLSNALAQLKAHSQASTLPLVPDAITFLSAVLEFMERFESPLDEGPRYVYISTLAFDTTIIGQMFADQFVSPFTWTTYGKLTKAWLTSPDMWDNHADFSAFTVVPSYGGPIRYARTGNVNGQIQTWDLETGLEVSQAILAHDGPILCLAYSSDGRYMVSSSKDGKAKVWDVQSHQLVCSYSGHLVDGHNTRINCVAFCSREPWDGYAVISGGDDSTLHIWDVRTGGLLEDPLQGHCGPVVCLSVSSDGAQALSSANEDPYVRLWDTKNGHLIRTIDIGSSPHVSACSPDGKFIVVANDDIMKIWDSTNGQEVLEDFTSFVEATSLTFSFPEKGVLRLARGYGDNDVYVRDFDVVGSSLKLKRGYGLGGNKNSGKVLGVSLNGQSVVHCSPKAIRISDTSKFRPYISDSQGNVVGGNDHWDAVSQYDVYSGLEWHKNQRGQAPFKFWYPGNAQGAITRRRDTQLIAPVSIGVDWSRFIPLEEELTEEDKQWLRENEDWDLGLMHNARIS